MLFPITHVQHFNRIIKYVRRKEYLYGSRRYGWATYIHPEFNITVDSQWSAAAFSNQKIEILHDDFIIFMNQTWPFFNEKYGEKSPTFKPNSIDRETFVWQWNFDKLDRSIDVMLFTNNNMIYESGLKVDAEYEGNLEDIESLSTLLWFNEED